jgi:hypothetical protein
LDIVSTIIGAVIGAVGGVVAALVARPRKEKDPLPNQTTELANRLAGLQRQVLKAVRKYDKGKRLGTSSDREQVALATYRTLASMDLVKIIETDSGEFVITLTDLGWQVATVADRLK